MSKWLVVVMVAGVVLIGLVGLKAIAELAVLAVVVLLPIAGVRWAWRRLRRTEPPGAMVVPDAGASQAMALAPPANITHTILLAVLMSSLVTAALVILVMVWVLSPAPAGVPVAGETAAKTALTSKLARFESLASAQEQATYERVSQAQEYQRSGKVPWALSYLSEADVAIYRRVQEERNAFLSQPQNADVAGFYMRRDEEARQGRDYAVDDYLEEARNSQVARVVEQRATAKYQLQRQLAEYLRWREENILRLNPRWGGDRLLSQYLATRPLLNMYLDYRQASGVSIPINTYLDLGDESKVDAFVRELAAS